MDSHRRASLIFFLAVVALFLSGIAYLFAIRFEEGDIYPPYSSYRSDPLGTRAFYESLGLLPTVRVSRNIDPLRKTPGMGSAVFLFAGFNKAGFRAMDAETVGAIEKAAQEGARVIFAFAPEKGAPQSEPSGTGAHEGEKPANRADNSEKKPEDVRGLSSSANIADLFDRWHIGFRLLASQHGQAHRATGGKEIPPVLDWHSALVFEPKEATWRTVYEREGASTVVERKMGKGEIVLLSDSFLMSNEAMKGDRQTDFLTWLCQGRARIVFDETHLGISAAPGIVTLLKKEGLAPMFASLIVLVLLAIWMQSASFVPPVLPDEAADASQERTYRTGMTGLFKRNIPADDLLEVCLAEWERSLTHGTAGPVAYAPRIRTIIAEERQRPRKMRAPAQAYAKISAIVGKKK